MKSEKRTIFWDHVFQHKAIMRLDPTGLYQKSYPGSEGVTFYRDLITNSEQKNKRASASAIFFFNFQMFTNVGIHARPIVTLIDSR